MFRIVRLLRYTIHSPRGVPFQLTVDDSIKKVQDKYDKRWFGAKMEFLDVQPPRKEFLPFYLCEGRIHGTFTGSASYNESNSNNKNGGTTTRTVTSGPHNLDTAFGMNQTQIYAGYKYNILHVHTALVNEQIPLHMKKMNTIDTSGATLNLFEQSTATMKDFLFDEVKRQATETATATVRQFHPSASSITVSFQDLQVDLQSVTPCFVPAYVIKATYNDESYHLFVSGLTGKVGGPYLLNPLYVARVSGLTTLALVALMSPNKISGIFFGSIAGVVVYYLGYYGAKYFPSYRRDYMRRKREKLRQTHEKNDSSGFKPDPNSQRRTEEYHHSSYWDNHQYEQRKTSTNFNNNSGTTGGWGQQRRIIRDSKGYYKTLGLQGDESVNEIRSAYRKVVLKNHPDVGGTDAEMVKINEAYRVLRDPKRREDYDRS